MKRINVLLAKADGKLESVYIDATVDEIRKLLGGPIDTVTLFTDCLTYIRRQDADLCQNPFMNGIYGDILFAGGKGSYLTDLPYSKKSMLITSLRNGRSVNGGSK